MIHLCINQKYQERKGVESRVTLTQIFLLFMLLPLRAHAADSDPFSTKKEVSTSPSKNMIVSHPLQDSCALTAINVIDLSQAVEQALCHNPQTRQAWAAVKVQAALVGVVQSAYLPTVSLSGSYTQGHNNYLVQDTPALSYNSKTVSRNFELNANWVLFDFGLRQANLDNARQLLIAANATEDATLQTVFITAAQAYYDVLSAQSALNAYFEAEKFSGESFKAADAQYRAGAGSLADKLQAQTNFAQAKLDRVKAVGDLKIAQGVLALAMGMDANTLLTAKADDNDHPNMAFVTAVDQLILEAKRAHPSILAAQAQFAAANAQISAVQNEGLPKISLTGSITRDHQTGQPPSAIDNHNSSIGIQVSIPLFEGFNRTYRVRVARAEAESKAADLSNTEKQISLDVWRNYQMLTTDTENLTATDELLNSAKQSADVAKGRYKAGVGTIIELLNAQSALAKAEQQRVQALADWRIMRLKLANSLGRLGFWAIRSSIS